MANAGDTVKLQASFYNWAGALADPTTIILRIYDENRTQIGADISIGSGEKASTGVYQYYYTLSHDTEGTIYYEFSGDLESYPVVSRDSIVVAWV